MQTDKYPALLLALTATKRVRTTEGSRKFKLPIGAEIHNRPGGGLWAPGGPLRKIADTPLRQVAAVKPSAEVARISQQQKAPVKKELTAPVKSASQGALVEVKQAANPTGLKSASAVARTATPVKEPVVVKDVARKADAAAKSEAKSVMTLPKKAAAPAEKAVMTLPKKTAAKADLATSKGAKSAAAGMDEIRARLGDALDEAEQQMIDLEEQALADKIKQLKQNLKKHGYVPYQDVTVRKLLRDLIPFRKSIPGLPRINTDLRRLSQPGGFIKVINAKTKWRKVV